MPNIAIATSRRSPGTWLDSGAPCPAFPVERPLASESVPTAAWRWLAAALDELDYGIVLLFDGPNVVHINHAARVELDDEHPLQLFGNELRARSVRDIVPLHQGITAAASQGLRRLLTLGDEARRSSVSIIPLDAADAGPRAVLVVLGKRAVSEPLSIQGFARSYQLTSAETRVLVALCGDLPPLEMSSRLGVAISTIRSQIGSIRAKTGAASIRALVRQVAALPPVKSSLRNTSMNALPEAAAAFPRRY